mmetsp:Transcript_14487/g.47600  ORF Transcript_14487/g.47600 Transcript_14487/m.47600 type:complete len:200 (-) Transcript_14487:669-1268(-)
MCLQRRSATTCYRTSPEHELTSSDRRCAPLGIGSWRRGQRRKRLGWRLLGWPRRRGRLAKRTGRRLRTLRTSLLGSSPLALWRWVATSGTRLTRSLCSISRPSSAVRASSVPWARATGSARISKSSVVCSSKATSTRPRGSRSWRSTKASSRKWRASFSSMHASRAAKGSASLHRRRCVRRGTVQRRRLHLCSRRSFRT